MTADPARTKGPRHRRATRHSPPGRLVVALAALASAWWALPVAFAIPVLGSVVVVNLQLRLMDVAGEAQTVGAAMNHASLNAANALVFAIMGFVCLFGAPIANRIGLAWTLVLGAVGYPLYSAGLYCNNRYGNVWFVLVGAAACGFSAGLFWASEGAIALGYPEPAKRGKYMNIWLWFRTGGPLVGGAIVLALNNAEDKKDRGAVGYQTYLVFIALQCLSVPVALLLSPPEKVQRADGSRVMVRAEKSFKAEFVALWKTSCQRKVLLLLPIFWTAYFNQYAGNFQSIYFGVRARALIGFVSNFGTLLSSSGTCGGGGCSTSSSGCFSPQRVAAASALPECQSLPLPSSLT